MIDKHILASLAVGETDDRGGSGSLATQNARVIERTAYDTNLIGTDDASIIAIGACTCGILHSTLSSNLTTRQDVDVARLAGSKRHGTEFQALGDNDLASATYDNGITIGHTLVEAQRPSARHIDTHIATNAERRQVTVEVVADTQAQAIVTLWLSLK